jgi:5-methylcytosine-specific restriction endonuclease McrA
MTRTEKTILNRDKAVRLCKEWGVQVAQGRYRETGDWYSALTRFPAALFDANGYVIFATEEEYRNSPHISIGKQISVPEPGISAIPSYVRALEANTSQNFDVDIHDFTVTEGEKRLVVHLQRERNQTIVRKKKAEAKSLDCEVCGFSFARVYGSDAKDYCEVHHKIPLNEAEHVTQTRMEDLAILCANCHRVVHLKNPPYTFGEVQNMFSKNETV